MKIIVIGLGNFGSSLGLRLVEDGHEVIGVDDNMSTIELLKDRLTHTVCLNATDEAAMQKLPLEDADYIIIAIGEDVGASITSAAIVKKHCNTSLMCRSINGIHQTVMESMGIEHIINPEETFAQDLANRLLLKGALRSIPLAGKYEIVEIKMPPGLVGKAVQEAELRVKYNLNIVTLIKREERRNFLGRKILVERLCGVVKPDTILEAEDILVVFGRGKDIRRFVEDNDR